MLIASIIILGGRLRSYMQPFIIMSVIPFGIVGAVLGHFFLGYDLTFISLSTGILFVTPIVLVLVPCLLLILEDIKQLVRNRVTT
jgi:multidrug efflux pump subunit AcrB